MGNTCSDENCSNKTHQDDGVQGTQEPGKEGLRSAVTEGHSKPAGVPMDTKNQIVKKAMQDIGEFAALAKLPPSEKQILEYPDKSQYYGQLKEGKKQGLGRLVSQTGGVVEGSYDNDLLHGEARIFKENGDVFQGIFVKGKAENKGKYTKASGKEYYEGEFKNDQPHGQGLIRYPNGDMYAGGFENGLRSGKGLYKLSNGDTYDGSFARGEYHGRGKLI